MLVVALMTFEQLDRSIDADSDSEDEMAHQAHQHRSRSYRPLQNMLNLFIDKSRVGACVVTALKAGSSPPRSDSRMSSSSLARGAYSAPQSPQQPPRPLAASKLSVDSEAKPPLPIRPSTQSASTESQSDNDDDDDDDPFADSHAVTTPVMERNAWI